MTSAPGDPLWQEAPLDCRADLHPLDLAVAVVTNSRAVLEEAEVILGSPGPVTPGRPALTLAVVVGDPGTAPRAEPHRYRQRDDLFVAAGDGVLVTAALDSGTAAAFVAEGALVSGGGAAEIALGAPVWRFAARRGLVAIHAAAVTMPSGTAILRGPSGSGKSTVAAACGLGGNPVVADEVTWFDPLAAAPVLRGGRPTLALAPPACESLGPLPPTAGLDSAGKLLLPIAAMAGGRAHSAAVGPLVFLTMGQGTSWHRLGAAAARGRFDDELLPGERTQAAASVAAARDALIAAGAYELTVGCPGEAPAALEEVCADARGRRRGGT